MKIVIDIPDEEVPNKQDILTVDLHFIDGTVCECTYPFEMQEPCEDAISRQEVLDALDKSKYSNEFCEEHHIDWSINLGMAHIVVNELKPVTLQEPRTVTEFADRCQECGAKYGKFLEFAEWVASEIFDENWEYNKDAFEELACRRLAKLGIVRAKGDEWELVEPQESEG